MKFICLVICALFIGCATASNLNKISIGMTKSEVIEKLGNPDSTKVINGHEILAYSYYTSSFTSSTMEYWVVVDDGKVKQYGNKYELQKNL